MCSADIFRTRVVLQMQISALFGAEHFIFFKIYGVFARTRGRVELVRTFFGQSGSLFCNFVRMSFIWTTPFFGTEYRIKLFKHSATKFVKAYAFFSHRKGMRSGGEASTRRKQERRWAILK